MKKPEFFIHDVLQHDYLSLTQRKVVEKKGSFFGIFKEGMKPFGKEHEVVLLVVAEGIEKEPEWVAWIKANLKFKVACHGWRHIDYRKIPFEEALRELERAKRKIEDTFSQAVTSWFPPKDHRGERIVGLSEELGLKYISGVCTPERFLENPKKNNKVDFHYWHRRQLKDAKKIIDFCLKHETY